MSKEIKLLFTGDYCPAGIDFKKMEIDPELTALLRSADGVIGNLESPITQGLSSRSGQFINLKSAPELNPLTECFTAFSLANNHIMDFGEKGAQETAAFLDNSGISYFGFGRSAEKAALPLRLKINEKSLAFFGITQWYCGTKTRSGTCSDRNRNLFANIRESSRNGDFVIVLPHWNYEFATVPAPAVRKLARKLIRAGADLVVGAHPHVVNGIESINDKTVAYCLGNFIFPVSFAGMSIAGSLEQRQSFLLEVSINGASDKYSINIHPVEFSESHIGLLSGKSREIFNSEIEKLSSVLSNNRSARKAFYNLAPKLYSRVSSNMGSIRKKQGFRAIIKRLHRVRIQDILVTLQAQLKRNR